MATGWVFWLLLVEYLDIYSMVFRLRPVRIWCGFHDRVFVARLSMSWGLSGAACCCLFCAGCTRVASGRVAGDPASPAARRAHSSTICARVNGFWRGLYFPRFTDTSFLQANLACFT